MQEDQGKIEGLFANLGRKMDDLLQRAQQASEEYHLNDKLDGINAAKNKLEEELNNYIQDDERWAEVKHKLQNAATELKKAFDITFNRKAGGSPPPPADPASHYEEPQERTLGTP